jgi:hypothetical protein
LLFGALLVVPLLTMFAARTVVHYINAETTGERIPLQAGAHGMVRPSADAERTTRVEIVRVSETTAGGRRTWSVEIRLQNNGAASAPAPGFELQLDTGKPAAQAFVVGEAPLLITDAPAFGGPLSSGGSTRSSPSSPTLTNSLLRIEPGRSVQGWIRWTIPEGARPAHLRVTPGIGVSGSLTFDLP